MTDEQTSTDEAYFHEDMATFGDRMAAARDSLGLEQNQLARRLGVKGSTIAGWEDDRAEPRANRLQMLAGVLGVSITWLLSGQGDGPTAVAEDDVSADTMALLAEMRRIRTEQARLTERLGIVEKRLRAALS
ncbi:Helix-turn-helix [Monaibacterium marinum]|uniref:Helix-turn-helix n=1 Tax=Pontivivens marinum TaxID=1690039 RepID=A0A2C9CTE5_9RHOB|nr:helix-turn-helix domain-containing protein [Monaibacterium marinum]SOH93649.1 Helix-turn-helix [Monaibacterium marinum]